MAEERVVSSYCVEFASAPKGFVIEMAILRQAKRPCKISGEARCAQKIKAKSRWVQWWTGGSGRGERRTEGDAKGASGREVVTTDITIGTKRPK